MKKILTISLLAGTVLASGCMSAYNHKRVKNNMVEERILASGNKEAVDLLARGVKPVDVVKIRPTSDGAGASIAFDVSDLEGLKAYWVTVKKAPVSSTVSLLIDGAATYYLNKAINGDSGNSNERSGSGNVDINVEGSSSTTINVTTSDDTTTSTSTDSSDNREQYTE